MPDTSGNAPTRFHVLKDNGEWWTQTFGGPERMRWDRADAPVGHTTYDEAHKHAESAPEVHQSAGEWGKFFAEILNDALEDAMPLIEYQLKNAVLPRVKTTAKSAWNRVTNRPAHSIQSAAREKVRFPDVSQQADEDTRGHRLNLTPEEAQKQFKDIELLTSLLAMKLEGLTSALIREDGESEEQFLERREKAAQRTVRDITSSIQSMLDRDEARASLAKSTPVLAPGNGEIASRSNATPFQLQRGEQSFTRSEMRVIGNLKSAMRRRS